MIISANNETVMRKMKEIPAVGFTVLLIQKEINVLFRQSYRSAQIITQSSELIINAQNTSAGL